MELTSSPFAKLPVEIYDSILKFLTEDELLTAALISRPFHDAVFKSSVFMRRIFVRVNAKKTERLQPSFIMMSKRRYQNVKISGVGIDQITQKTYSWFRFISSEILEKFAESIVYVESDIDLARFDVELPRLRTLKFITDPIKALDLQPDGLMATLTTVKELTLIYPLSVRSKQVLMNHLKANASLETLVLNESLISSDVKPPFFDEPFNTTDIKAKLKKFALIRCYWRSESHWEHIIAFLKTQSSTLEFLKIDTCSLEAFKTLLLELPKLVTFEGNFYKLSNEHLVIVPRNFSLKCFKATTIHGYEATLAKSLRELRVLKIFQLTYASLDKIMSLQWPALKQIRYCHYLGRFAEPEKIEESYSKLLLKHPLFSRRVKFVQMPVGEQQTFF